jgi:hypothetical protein
MPVRIMRVSRAENEHPLSCSRRRFSRTVEQCGKRRPSTMEIIMINLTPHHVQEAESDRRGIKDGWYASNIKGRVSSSRFSSREACQAHIEQERSDIDAYHEGAAHGH